MIRHVTVALVQAAMSHANWSYTLPSQFHAHCRSGQSYRERQLNQPSSANGFCPSSVMKAQKNLFATRSGFATRFYDKPWETLKRSALMALQESIQCNTAPCYDPADPDVCHKCCSMLQISAALAKCNRHSKRRVRSTIASSVNGTFGPLRCFCKDASVNQTSRRPAKEWSSCSARCGKGQKHRVRRVWGPHSDMSRNESCVHECDALRTRPATSRGRGCEGPMSELFPCEV